MKKFLPISLLAALAVFSILALSACAKSTTGQYDELTKYLSAQGVKEYSAFWCSACKKQRELLGESYKYINNTECSTPDGRDQTEVCKAKAIKGYPTWEFPGSEMVASILSPEELAKKIGFDLATNTPASSKS
ncbi:MAG: hypothetical protein V1826_02820 [bacterium]